MATEQQPKLCFVIGPIGDEDSEQRIHADWLYTGIILPVFEKHLSDFAVDRADKIPTPGMVSSQIINRLHDAELVIADLSFHNANAFYEMSIRHNVGKPIIHMIRKGERIPFDVIPHRAIPFALAKPDDQAKARELLLPAIQAAIQPGFQADNPIQHARGRLELDKQASPALKVLSDEIQDLKAQLAQTRAIAMSAVETVARPVNALANHVLGWRNVGLLSTPDESLLSAASKQAIREEAIRRRAAKSDDENDPIALAARIALNDLDRQKK